MGEYLAKKTIPGFTLLSLLIALAITSVLLVASFYGARDWFSRNQALAVAKRIQGALQYARTIAILRGMPVSLCGARSSTTCTQAWTQGQLIFQDNNYNGKVDADDQPLRFFPALKYNAQLTWRGFQSASALTFLPLGMGTGLNGYFQYCADPEHPQWSWRIVVNRVGRERWQRFPCHPPWPSSSSSAPLLSSSAQAEDP